ncbi:tail fiber domain-containing protein, partial [bacterium]|nr:tail fiber domain-containing protein [bacterium]
GSDGEMEPRQKLSTVGYAFRSIYADSAGYVTGGVGEGWSLAGNTGTSPGVDFVGTTDGNALDFRTDDILRMRITTKGQLELYNATSTTPTSTDMILIGQEAGENQTYGTGTVFIGHQAGTSSENAAFTVGIGYQALHYNTTGDNNTAIGYQAMHGNDGSSSGLHNTAVGFRALYSNPNKMHNTAVGSGAMFGNEDGENNVAVGFNALMNNCGDYNTAVGWEALDATTSSATFNTGIGKSALGGTTSGTYNTALGANALLYNVSGTYNTAVGNMTGPVSGATNLTNTTCIGNGAVTDVSDQVRLGNSSISTFYCQGAYAATTASAPNMYVAADGQIMRSTASGGSVGWSLTGNAGTVDGTNFIGTTDDVPFTIRVNNQRAGRISTSNSTYGYLAGNSLSTGATNTLIGTENGYYMSSGEENTFVGRRSGYFMQSGNSNTAVGYNALYCYGAAGGGPFPGGSGNVAVGKWAMFNPTIGDYNVAVGYSTYSLPHTGSRNVFLGYYSDIVTSTDPSDAVAIGSRSEAGGDNATALGAWASAPDDNTLILGSIAGVNGATASIKVGIGTISPNAALHVITPNLSADKASIIISPVGNNGSSSSEFSLIDFWSTFDGFSGDQGPRRTASIKAHFVGGTWDNEALSICVGGATDAANEPAERLRITATGNNQTAGGSWSSISDRRVKTEVFKLNYGLKEVMQIESMRYNFHDPRGFEYIPEKISGEGNPDIGFIAQDLYKIAPEVVFKPDDEEKQLWGIKYEKLTPILVRAIQEQQAQMESQRKKFEARIEALEKRISELESS